MRCRLGPQAVLRAITRGALWRRETWRWLSALLRSRRPVLPGDFPAHVHVNVERDQRGKDVGRQLLECFEQQVRAARLPGMHASVRGDNVGGRRFFERMGFVVLASSPMILPLRTGRLKTETVVYGKKL
jgi:ribosomal protein S18 acetylase RimI-like enzyme